jgi:hypothetical protein
MMDDGWTDKTWTTPEWEKDLVMTEPSKIQKTGSTYSTLSSQEGLKS